MKSVTINHLGKRPYDFVADGGNVVYYWTNYVGHDSWDRVEVGENVNKIVKTERVSKHETVVFYA